MKDAKCFVKKEKKIYSDFSQSIRAQMQLNIETQTVNY